MEYGSLISSRLKLERDKGLEIIKDILKSPKDGEISSLEATVLELLREGVNWESILGALCAAGLVLEAGVGSEDFCTTVQAALPDLLEHEEPRVRLAAGEIFLK